MANLYPISTLSDYEVMIQAPLSSFEQKIIKKHIGQTIVTVNESIAFQ